MKIFEGKTRELPKGDFGTSTTTVERGGQRYVPIIGIKEFLCNMVMNEMEKKVITDVDRGRAEAIKEIYKFIDSF